MKCVFKIIGCALLGFLCVAVPVLTAFSLVYQWGTFLSLCLLGLSIADGCIISIAFVRQESEE